MMDTALDWLVYVLWFVVGFLGGWIGCEIVRVWTYRRKPIANPYVQTGIGRRLNEEFLEREHQHTRPPGWHP